MKKAIGILAVCGSLLGIVLLITAVLGIFVYRNLYPAKDASLVPDTAGKFRLKEYNFGSGNLTGTVYGHRADYVLTEEGKDKVFSYSIQSIQSAEKAQQIAESFPCESGTIKKTDLKDKQGNMIGKLKICRKRLSDPYNESFIIFSNQKKWIFFNPEMETEFSTSTLPEMIEFIRDLPFNSEVNFDESNLSKTTSDELTSAGREILSAYELVKKHEESKTNVSKYNDREIMVRGYIKIPPTITDPSSGGLISLGKKTASFKVSLKTIQCWFEAEDVNAFSELKGEQYITVKGVFNGEYSAKLQYCKLVKAE